MANPNLSEYEARALQKPSRFDEKDTKRKDKAATWRLVCQQVDKRDFYRCRCCGAAGNPDGVDLLDRLHRHHLEYRSKGGNDVASNLTLLCARCHDSEHRHRLRIVATSAFGADGALEFWRTDQDGQEFMVKRETACNVTERD